MFSFKKTIACLMSLIMIMTVTPFTAVTASAATAKSVSSNIDETNKKYHAAPSKTFTAKTGLSEVFWSNSAEVNDVSSSDGKSHKQSYAPSSNVLYWPSAYNSENNCLRFQSNYLEFMTFYPSAVLMWDGTTDAYMPIMCVAQNSANTLFDGNRTIYYAAPYDSERISNATSPAHSANFYADTWRGSKTSTEQNQNFNANMYGNNTPFGFEAKVLTEFISSGENANQFYNFGNDRGKRNLASFLHIDSNIDNDASFIADGFLAKKLYWTTNSSNVDFTTAYDNNSGKSSSTIYVVNYKPIVTAAKEAAKDLESFDQTLYTPDAVNEYYKAIQDLYDCDPNSSFNQNDGKDATDISDTAVRVANCTNDIKNRVSAYEKAKAKLENSKQYRIKFTNSNTELLSDNYYKAGDTIVAPVLSDSYEDRDETGHCTVTFEWQPAFEKTASKNVNYVETKIVPAKTPHNYGAYSQITQDGKNGHIRTCSECGYKDWALCDDHYVKKSSTPATCTQDEQIVYECSVCHRIKTEVGEKKKGHDYEVISPKVDATCETVGKTEVKKCKNCGDTIGGDVIPALKHDYSILVSKKQEATCTADGKEAEYECSKCGKHTGGEVIKATGHNYKYLETEKKIVCSKCGDEKKVDTSYVVPEGYTLVETVEPKCTEFGYTLYQNKDGEKFYNNVKSPTGHQYGETTVHPATCTEDEYSVRVCSVCNHKDVVTKEGTKLGHSYIKNVVAPTCTEQGYTIYKCKNCGDTYKDDYVKALGHTEVIDKAVAPTCTQSGLTEGKHCSVCNAVLVKQEKIDALGHKPVSANNSVRPTCTKDGKQSDTICSVCYETLKIGEMIKATGHNFGNNSANCLVCGVANPNYVAPSQPAPSQPAPNPTPSTPSTPATPAPSTPALTPGENKIANSYGVDSATAKLIYIYLTQNNISSETSSLTEKVMTGTPVKGDGDYKGSNFGLLKAKTTKITKKSVTVKWNKVKNADGYIVYGAKCGAKSKYKVLKVVSGKTTSYTQKKLKKGTYYKYNIVAFKNINGAKVTTAVSKKIHATTLGGKYGVAKAVKVNKTKATIKKGKTFKIKASEIKKDKKIRRHRAICYESSNTAVATVNAKGKVKGVKKGKCTIYVYAQNGVYKTVNIKVK
ncbi:Ig-like domain-containing protein [Ruminococcus sp.]|uniref:Ig-like domain-containing protein n=1 Tax=Ruminococcus sp. TaxID=41978 RepID=UPI003FD88C33